MKKEELTLKKDNLATKENKIKETGTDKILSPKRKQKVTKAVIIEANGNQIDVEDLKRKAEEEFKKQYPDEKIQDLKIYINTNEGTAYYVMNGRADDTFKILI